jgi:hypothetical protein
MVPVLEPLCSFNNDWFLSILHDFFFLRFFGFGASGISVARVMVRDLSQVHQYFASVKVQQTSALEPSCRQKSPSTMYTRVGLVMGFLI